MYDAITEATLAPKVRFASGPETARSGTLYRARSRLYRSQILQQNMRLKALAEIYTMHSFAQLRDQGTAGPEPSSALLAMPSHSRRHVLSAEEAANRMYYLILSGNCKFTQPFAKELLPSPNLRLMFATDFCAR